MFNYYYYKLNKIYSHAKKNSSKPNENRVLSVINVYLVNKKTKNEKYLLNLNNY
jgi:hypothetical protein